MLEGRYAEDASVAGQASHETGRAYTARIRRVENPGGRVSCICGAHLARIDQGLPGRNLGADAQSQRACDAVGGADCAVSASARPARCLAPIRRAGTGDARPGSLCTGGRTGRTREGFGDWLAASSYTWRCGGGCIPSRLVAQCRRQIGPVTGTRRPYRCSLSRLREPMLLDLMFISIAVLFFVVGWAYVRGCDRL